MGKKHAVIPYSFLAIFVVFILFIVVPIAYLLTETGQSINYFVQSFQDSFFPALLLRTIIIGFTVSLLTTIVGSLLGFFLYRTSIFASGILKLLWIIPLLLSPYIEAVAIKKVGILLSMPHLFYSFSGVVLTLFIAYLPLAIVITGIAFYNTGRNLEEAAYLNAPKYKVAWKITILSNKHAIFSSIALIFIFSVSSFSVPSYMGVNVLATDIFTHFAAFYNYNYAVAQSILLVFLCFLILLGDTKYIEKTAFFTKSNTNTNRFYGFSLKNKIVVSFVLWGLWLILIAFPIVTLFFNLFNNNLSELFTVWHILFPAIKQSVILALIASVFIVVIGYVSAFLSIRYHFKLFDKILLFVFAVPSIVFGIALIRFYGFSWGEIIYSSTAILIIGYTGKYSFIASKILGTSMQQINISLDEVAELSGAKLWKRIYYIWLPLLSPVIFLSFITGFIFSFKELSLTVMVYPPGMNLLPVKVYTLMANTPRIFIEAMLFVVFSVTLFILAIMWMIYIWWLHKKGRVYK